MPVAPPAHAELPPSTGFHPPGPAWLRVAARWLALLGPGLAAAGSGVALTACFAPFEQGWLCWVALVPLIGAVWWVVSVVPGPAVLPGNAGKLRRWGAHLRRRPGVRAAFLGYVCGLVFFWSVFSWLTTVTVPGWIGLGPYMACYPALWAWFLGRLLLALGLGRGAPTTGRAMRSRWNVLLAAAGAAAWVAQEWVRSWMFSGWGWNELGVALHDNYAFIQIAEWTGVFGLSFLVAFANLIAAATVRRFYLEMRQQREALTQPAPPPPAAATATRGLTLWPTRRGTIRPHFDFTLTLAGILAVFVFGVQLVASRRGAQPGETVLRVAAVQPAIPQFQKWNPRFQQEIFSTYRQLTDLALAKRPELLIWPEAATPQGFLNDRENFEFVMDIARRGGFHFLLGTVLGEPDLENPDRVKDYNAAALLAPGAVDPPQLYQKLHLVPYGEYIPFRHSFPLFAWFAGGQVPTDFSPGERPVVFQMHDPDVRLAPLICFEDGIGELVRQFVLPQPDGEPGAQVLVNVTNDAWFGRSGGGKQHFAESVFRAVETRRPLVRGANTGVSALVDRFGRVRQLLHADADAADTFGPGVLSGEITVPAPDAPLTFYVQHGELFAEVCATLAAVLGLRFLVAPFLRRRFGKAA